MKEFRLKLDNDQIKIINNSLGGTRFLYNKVVKDLDFIYKKNNKNIIRKDLDFYIEKNDFLRDIDYLSLQISKVEAEFNFDKLIKSDTEYKLGNILKRKDNKVQSYFISNKFNDINIEECLISVPMIPTRLYMILSEDEIRELRDIFICCIEIKKLENEYSLIIYSSFDDIYFSKNILKRKNIITNKSQNNFAIYDEIYKLFPQKIDGGNLCRESSKNIIGISRELDSFAVISSGVKIGFDDSLYSKRKKYFRESIKVRNRIKGSLGSKKSIEDNVNFQNRVKILKKITLSLDEKYRLFVDKTSQQLVEVFDEIYVEDLDCDKSCLEINEDKFITNIDVNVDVSYYKRKKEIKDKKLREVIEPKGIEEKDNTVDDVYWCMFLHLLEKYSSEKGKKIVRVKINPIEGIEFNEFERYSIGKSKGGKRGQQFNKEQKILKKKKSMDKYKYFSNPSRAREILYKGSNS